MKRISCSLILALFYTMLSYSQEVPDSQPQPEIQWDVNKEFDEEGNIIRFDSSYSYKWFSPGFDENLMDSLGHLFPFPLLDDPFFKEFFPDESIEDDSLAVRHFAFPLFDHIFPGMEDMMKRHMEFMDEFFQHHHLPADTLEFENQDWYVPPGRKKTAKQIEI